MKTDISVGVIPSISSGNWYFWSPREALAPDFTLINLSGRDALKIKSRGLFGCFGKWKCSVGGISDLETYSFSVEYLPENIKDEHSSVFALLTWLAYDGRTLVRDYIDVVCTMESGWRRLSRVLDAPRGAIAVVVELALRWTENGSVTWRLPQLVKTAPVMHRKARIAVTYLKGRQNPAANLAAMLSILDKAGKAGADIVALSETYYDRGMFSPQDIPGELTAAIGRKAEKHGMYVILNMNEKDGCCFYNTSVLIDRNGEIAGRYRKTHLPLYEAEVGVTPGCEYPVFDTDFGKIGLLTCWDHWFPETARILRIKGAELLFISTIGDASLQSRARAADNGIYVAVAGSDGMKPSRIINPEGEIIGEISSKRDGLCIREIELKERRYLHWYSVGDAGGEPRSLYMKERRPDIYNMLTGQE